jgi:tetratricopeptide (TPR) repeat protein
LVLAAAHLAVADEPPPPAPPPPRATVDPDTEVARRHFERGTELYDAQKYDAAIAEFQAANVARPRPAFDFNIARCYDRLGDWAHALDYYRRYLAAAGTLPDADEVRTRVQELEERVRKEAPPTPPPVAAPLPAPAPVAAPPPPRHRLRLAAIVVGAGALAAIGAAAGLYGSAAADFPARKSYCASLPRDCVPSEWADLSARADAGYALFAVGGALAAADVVLWTLELRRAHRHYALVTPAGAAF